MNIEGKLVEKFDTQSVSDSFKKREFIVEYSENPQYPEFLKMELIQNNCQQLDDLQAGELIAISFNLKGRKWTDPKGETKYFNSLQAWRVERKSATQDAQASTSWMKEDFSSDNDLPF